MDKNKLIHILLFVWYLLIILISFFIYLYIYFKNNKYRHYLSSRYNNILVFITLGILINSVDLLLIGILDKEIYGIIKFNIVYIFNFPSVILFSYRGIKCYNDYNTSFSKISKNQKKINKIYIGFLFLYITYILIINIFFDENINIKSWHFYPFYIFIILFVFIFHPTIIILLNKINNSIKYDFIYSFISTISCFGLFFISNYFLDDNSYILTYVSTYWSIISSIFIHFSCTFFHFIHISISKNKEDLILHNLEYNLKKSKTLEYIEKYYEIEKKQESKIENENMSDLFNNIINDEEIREFIENKLNNKKQILKIDDLNIYIDYLKEIIYIDIYKNNNKA